MVVELEHLKTKTRLIDGKKFVSVWGECETSMKKSCDGSGRIHDLITLTELLKLKKNGQFPDEYVRPKEVFIVSLKKFSSFL